MSEFTNNYERRARQLADYMSGLIEGRNGVELIHKYGIKTENFIPQDVLGAFDLLIDRDLPLSEIKVASNKLFNILYETLNSYPSLRPSAGTFLSFLIDDNEKVQLKLKEMKPLIKELNVNADKNRIMVLAEKFYEIQSFLQHYLVVENIIFPYLEKKWRHHRCVQIMWSFHDDIRRNLQRIQKMLTENEFELKIFNELTGLIFFNISTIILREEKIIIPILLETADTNELNIMLTEAVEMGLPFVDLKINTPSKKPELTDLTENLIHLPTGILTPEQIQLIFNHMPVDVTYVDENDEVKFYSNPPHRIFPRTPAIIGRKVQFCHPPESVHIVNRIVESFKLGEKDIASFWLHMGPKFVLIQYFAVRNEKGEYKGTLEVSQEISEIQKIEGNRKLLDW